ncbi:MAG: asparagine synthase-related protein [Candidatus Ratteibacteria bacterium]
MEQLILNLREKLKIISENNKGQFLLFSGGLDTSILAYLNPGLICVNVSLKDYGQDEIMLKFWRGYSYMSEIEDLNGYIKKISKKMEFSSNKIGKFFDLEIRQPFLDKELINFSLSIDKGLKIRDGYGKWILRKSFEDILPDEIIWQQKRPLEVGSGMSRLSFIIDSMISDREFQKKKEEYKINFFNKQHLYFFEIYKKIFKEIPKPKKGEKVCPLCKTGMKINSFHCKTCGYSEMQAPPP